jgi:hypothetical protein
MKKSLIGLLALAIVVLVAGGIWIYLSYMDSPQEARD